MLHLTSMPRNGHKWSRRDAGLLPRLHGTGAPLRGSVLAFCEAVMPG